MSRETLVNLAKDNIKHANAKSVALATSTMKIPASDYTDNKRWVIEKKKIFHRLPLLVAMSCELPEEGSYLSLEAAGIPMIITRDKNFELHAMLNSCSHRGAQILDLGCGKIKRLTCPFHAWGYGLDGSLNNVFASDVFGEIDKSQYGLVRLPAYENAGLIWVNPDPNSDLNISDYLCGYDDLLQHFNFRNWKIFGRRSIAGPNWKIAYDGYLDLYHLPILHRKTFGSDMPYKSLAYSWGPHTRVTSPDPDLAKESLDVPPEDFDIVNLTSGVWTIFPHVSIASFDAGCRGVLISQLFPGSSVSESTTIQTYMISRDLEESEVVEAQTMFDLLETVVSEEDYKTGLKQQAALETGLRNEVIFGRNEEGCQTFHRWVDKILETPDSELPKLFKSAYRWEHTK